MDPNLADRVRFTTRGRLDIDNLDLGVASCLLATAKRAGAVIIGGSLDDAMLFERIGADGTSDWSATGHFQRRFRQPVGRIDRFPTKAAFAKLVGKALQCLEAHRLRAVISHSPTLQIQSCAL